MQEIIGEKDKTISPYIETAKDLYENYGVSTIMVAGSFSPSIAVADLVLKMSGYKAYNITIEAKELFAKYSDYQVRNIKFSQKAVKSPRIVDSDNFRILKRQKPFGISAFQKTLLFF